MTIEPHKKVAGRDEQDADDDLPPEQRETRNKKDKDNVA